jgi:uncharacterized repeat protein (TIGR03803 family)
MGDRRRLQLRILVGAAIVALVAPAVTTAQDAVTVLHAFAGGTEGHSSSSLIQATDGDFYGTNDNGGTSGYGTVFKVTPAGTVTVLHTFAGGSDGAYPAAALIQATDGSFYGTTVGDFASNFGTVFRMTPGGTVTVLHAFAGGADGSYPEAALIQATDGNFYGTTFGGTSDHGTVFKMTPTGAVTVLHAFAGGLDGATPGVLIQASDGNFYGTTDFGGGFFHCVNGPHSVVDCGTVFKMTPAGSITVLHAFTGGTDGGRPRGIMQTTDGNFYGTTSVGGASYYGGTVFKITPAGTVTVLHAFAGGLDGASPESAPIQATNGNFYGTTAVGGTSDYGTVFTMTPAGTVTVLYAFTGGTDGGLPYTAIIQATDGNFYGTNNFGGGAPGYDGGVVFELTLAGAPAITTQPQSQTIASGQRATLSVVASGSGLRYQWYVGTAGTTTSPIAGATAHSYATPALTSTTSYWVLVSNSVDTADSKTATIIVHTAPGDFDGGGRSDMSVFRPSTGLWYILESNTNYTTSLMYAWGVSTDVPVPGDYDGDGKTDPAVYRPSTGMWYVLDSSANYTTSLAVAWGVNTDVPVPGDYDGDGKADIAVYRPSTGQWFILTSASNYMASAAFSWGVGTDVPVPGDYDGDGKADPAVYRPSTGQWFILTSSSHYTADIVQTWGISTDVPLQGDYDGDGRADPAAYRPSTGQWFILTSSSNYTSAIVQAWGVSTDVPLQGDYDGDGKADPAVYRPSTGQWFILTSSSSYTAAIVQAWGISTDTPINKQP